MNQSNAWCDAKVWQWSYIFLACCTMQCIMKHWSRHCILVSLKFMGKLSYSTLQHNWKATLSRFFSPLSIISLCKWPPSNWDDLEWLCFGNKYTLEQSNHPPSECCVECWLCWVLCVHRKRNDGGASRFRHALTALTFPQNHAGSDQTCQEIFAQPCQLPVLSDGVQRKETLA